MITFRLFERVTLLRFTSDGQAGVSRHSLAVARSFLALGGAKCLPTYRGLTYSHLSTFIVVFSLLKENSSHFHPFDSRYVTPEK